MRRKSKRSSEQKSTKLAKTSATTLKSENLTLTILQEMHPTVREVLGTFRPPPTLTIAQWSDRERFLSAEHASEPGRWHTDRVPYMRGIMDAVNDPAVQRIVVAKAVQVAYTETL